MSPLRPPHVNGLDFAPEGSTLITPNQWGGGGPLLGPPQSLVQLQANTFEPGPITVTLAGVRAGGGDPSAAAQATGLPRDNLVLTNYVERAVTVRWGNGGAFEEATVDWPFGGATFTVHAAALSVTTVDRQTLLTPAVFVAPQVAAFATLGARGGQGAPFVWTHTVSVSSNPDNAAYVAIPRRAVAYQLASAVSGDDLRSLAVDVLQIIAAGGINNAVQCDRSRLNGNVWSASTPAPEWTPLVGAATALQIGQDVVAAGSDRDLRVTFALDFG